MQYQLPALLAQLNGVATLGERQAIFVTATGLTIEAQIAQPGLTTGDYQAREQFWIAHWQAFTTSLTSQEPQVVFDQVWFERVVGYGAITASAFKVEWGTVIAAYRGGQRYDAAQLLQLRFELAQGEARFAGRYVDLNPDEKELHRHLQCELWEMVTAKGLNRANKVGRLRAAFEVIGRHVTSWTELTPAEMVKLIKAIAAGAYYGDWQRVPAVMLQAA